MCSFIAQGEDQMTDLQSLFGQLFAATTSAQVSVVLRGLGDRSDQAPGVPIGDSGLEWRLFGDTLSNQSSIGLGTKSGRSITERVTNGFDAILEKRAQHHQGTLPESPSLAAERWFGRPVTGPDTGLFSWKYSTAQYDKLVSMVLLPSDILGTATIDVIDRGSGIPSAKLPTTILSLQQGNKITKKYLAGAYGQGGSATLSFCDYALVISRSVDEPDTVSFTLIRILSMSDDYKVDAYAYLVLSNERKAVPNIHANAIDLYQSVLDRGELSRLVGDAFTNGTIVRHFSYRLNGLDGKLGPGIGNLYHFLQSSLFDPLLPVGLIDLRDANKPRREVILGSRNRLMKRTLATGQEDEEDEQFTRVQLRHYRPMEYFAPHGGSEPTIGMEYWVVFAYRKSKNGMERRGYSCELFANRLHPIIGTLNGQNHGELSAQIIRDAGLPLLSRHMIVHIDASRVGARVIRELFSTNREGFKEGPVLMTLQEGLQAMLKDDSRLAELERELIDDIATQSNQSASDEVKRQVVNLLLEAGFKPQGVGPAAVAGRGEEGIVKPPVPRPIVPDPLSTLPFPQVTKWQIVYPVGAFELPLSALKTIVVETDADSAFDAKALLSIRFEPPVVDVASKSVLKAGRIRWRVKANETARTGEDFLVTCTLTKPDGTQLTSDVAGTIVPAPVKSSKAARAPIPNFDIIGIHPKDDGTTWNALWPDLDADDSSDEKLASVAYKTLKTDKLVVYYSKVFTPYASELHKLTASDSPLLPYFKANYEVWIGYHAILQYADTTSAGRSEEFGTQLEEERYRVATVEVKQALKNAEVLHKLQVAESQEAML
jgi:hypothetical protein